MLLKERPINHTVYQSLSHYPQWLASILSRRFDDANKAHDALTASLSKLPSPFALPDMKQAAEIVVEAIIRNKFIQCIVDYDTDGISSGAVLYEGLRNLGANINVFVTNRHEDGYGFSAGACTKLLAFQHLPDVLITADLGSSDGLQIERLQKEARLRGHDIKVIVTDHHHISDTTPPKTADAFINPHRKDVAHDYHVPICGAVVAWNLVAAVNNIHKTNNLTHFDVKTLLDIGAVATVGDMVDLSHPVNRIIVKYGLSRMNNPETSRLAWNYLRSFLQTGADFDTETIGFQISPRINALSRMGDDGSTALQWLTADNEQTCLHAWSVMTATNEDRKAEQQICEELALEQASIQVNEGRFVIVCYVPEANHGVVGLAAGRIATTFGKPAIVLADAHAGGLTGSARSIPGFDIRSVIDEAQNRTGVLTKFGGHAAAAGLSMHQTDLERFHDVLDTIVVDFMNGVSPQPTLVHDGDLPGELLDLHGLNQLLSVAPFGQGFPSPTFKVQATVSSVRLMGGDKQHARFLLDIDGFQVTAVWFNFDYPVMDGDMYTFVVSVTDNIWNGKRSLQLMVQGIE